MPTGAPRILQRGGYYARFLRSGHLIYINQSTLFAAPFDPEKLEMTGQPVPAIEGVNAYPSGRAGAAQFAVSSTGVLAYVGGQSAGTGAPIHWMDRDGKTIPLRPAAASWSSPHFAPDGRRLAMHISEGQQSDVWIYEWERDVLSRLAPDPASDENPVWTPDARRIVFASRRAKDVNALNLFWQRADGTGEVQRLTESKNNQWPASWHPNGKELAFWETSAQTGTDLMLLSLEGDEASGWRPGKPRVFLNDASTSTEPMFSPDGRWLAYFSAETGRNEIYVRPYSGSGGKVQISTGGANSPTWSRTRPELFFGSLDRQIMIAPYTIEGDVFRAEKARPWSETHFGIRTGQRPWDLHPDGQRVAVAAVAALAGADRRDKVVFIFNFFDELRRLAPVKR